LPKLLNADLPLAYSVTNRRICHFNKLRICLFPGPTTASTRRWKQFPSSAGPSCTGNHSLSQSWTRPQDRTWCITPPGYAPSCGLPGSGKGLLQQTQGRKIYNCVLADFMISKRWLRFYGVKTSCKMVEFWMIANMQKIYSSQ
jgi:hypothetical protein